MPTEVNNIKVFNISENGFSVKDNTVAIPACKIKATGWIEAKNKLERFLSTKELTDDIELITPIERISF